VIPDCEIYYSQYCEVYFLPYKPGGWHPVASLFRITIIDARQAHEFCTMGCVAVSKEKGWIVEVAMRLAI
jgi:hypothetical protein